MKQTILKGKKVILRPMRLSDAVYFCKWLGDPEVTNFLECYGESAPTLQEEKEYVKKNRNSLKRIQFAIDAADGEFIGTVALNQVNYYNRCGEYGIFIGNKKYWGQGCGTEAGKLFLNYVFKKLKLNSVYLFVVAFNIRGIKSYQKIGFKKTGKIRGHYYRNGFYHNRIVMDILRNEYLKK